MPVEVGDGEREAVVDADDGRGVRREFLAKPLGEAAPRPVSPWTGWGLNLRRFIRALGHKHPEPSTTGVRRHRAGVVDADMLAKWGNPVTSRGRSVWGFQFFMVGTCRLQEVPNHFGST